MKERFGISGNTLKVIAAISMAIDHIGLIFFPGVEIFRVLGRLALPIFAFMIAEGCKYTRNKLRYFLTVFSLATVCQLVYFIYDGDTYMSILVTFSLSILTVYALQFFKETLFDKTAAVYKKILSGILFLLTVACVYGLNMWLEIDYGFFGCMLPVFASLFHATKGNNKVLYNFDKIQFNVLSLCVGLALLSIESGGRQFFAFLAVPLLLLYSGKRGKANIKYFFYAFYPAHLILIYIAKGLWF